MVEINLDLRMEDPRVADESPFTGGHFWGAKAIRRVDLFDLFHASDDDFPEIIIVLKSRG